MKLAFLGCSQCHFPVTVLYVWYYCLQGAAVQQYGESQGTIFANTEWGIRSEQEALEAEMWFDVAGVCLSCWTCFCCCFQAATDKRPPVHTSCTLNSAWETLTLNRRHDSINIQCIPPWPNSSCSLTSPHAANCILWFHCGVLTMVQDLLRSVMKLLHIGHISSNRCRTLIRC